MERKPDTPGIMPSSRQTRGQGRRSAETGLDARTLEPAEGRLCCPERKGERRRSRQTTQKDRERGRERRRADYYCGGPTLGAPRSPVGQNKGHAEVSRPALDDRPQWTAGVACEHQLFEEKKACNTSLQSNRSAHYLGPQNGRRPRVWPIQARSHSRPR